MKNRLSLFLLLLLGLSACKNNKEPLAPLSDNVFAHIYAYTSGTISRTAPIKIQFVKDAVAAEKVGTKAEANLLSFSPDIAGTLTWENQRTLRFDPAKFLASGKEYRGTMTLSKLINNLPEDARSFSFDFRTRDMGYSLKKEGFKINSTGDLTKQDYRGSIVTSDFTEAEAIEKTLSARQNGNNLNVEWVHEAGGTRHNFTVKGIERKEKEGSFTLSYNATDIGVNDQQDFEITVPGLDDFKVLSAEVGGGEEQYLRLVFSDPIMRSQDMTGLVRIAGYKGSLKYSVEGNEVFVYPSGRLRGTQDVVVESNIKNTAGKKMANISTWNLTFEEEKPQVRLVGRGVIIPNNDPLLFPFEAINLDAVEVEIFKIFNNNILQFLQTSNISDENAYQVQRVGRIISQEKISLRELSTAPNKDNWVRYALDLSPLIDDDPHAIYQVRIGFRQGYSDYFCEGDAGAEEDGLTVAGEMQYEEEDSKTFRSIMDSYYGLDGYYSDYDYDDRDDPCKGAYYNNDRFVKRNLIASDLGIITKKGKDKSWFVAVNDIKSTDPISGAEIKFYDYQQQLLKSAKTDSDGVLMTTVEEGNTAFVVAEYNNQKGYIKIRDGRSLSLSRFDVGGAVSQKGRKGFIYGERGVWRPGDSLYLNFILEDKNNTLPANHPVNYKLFDARGQEYTKRTVYDNTNGIFALHTATRPDDPTGNWRAEVKVGSSTFTKILKVETIKPNRLKAKLDFGKEELTASDMPANINIQANWLHGAPANSLQVKTEMQIRQTGLNFPKFQDYTFKDPTRRMQSGDTDVRVVFEGNTNPQGQAKFSTEIYEGSYAPGKIKANFRTRVFEKGGDFSTSNSSVTYHPYDSYTGINLPKNRWGSREIDVDKTGQIKVAVTDTKGNPLSGKKLKLGIYRVSWRWWWDSRRDNVAAFNSSTHTNATIKADLTSKADGTASYDFTPKEWGRYLIRICDEESGHCSGDYLYSGRPWYDDEESGPREGATMLAFSSDKQEYEVGETVEINVPANNVSQVLVTLETGSRVIQSFRRSAVKGENTFRFQVTEEMAPTVYAHVSLTQPHAQTVNDLPIRMYGVIPIRVTNPETVLEPQIKMAEELRPEEKFTVSVSENSGKAMAYTLAVVDEGLLDLTNFKTPNPHASFYAREALGVQTFDIYDEVVGAFGGDLSRVLSIGGDGEGEGDDDGKKQANRFKPVVMHLGPFYLGAGRSAKHEITMPNYVGSVRVMAVAANENAAYGKAEKTVPVRKPLMVLATLPRVLGPGETLRLPVSVFAMDKKVKNASITVSEKSGLIGIGQNGKQSLSFDQIGDKIAYFDLKVGDETGIAKFDVQVSGAGEKASQQIEIQVRNPNPYVSNVEAKILKPGDSWDAAIKAIGTPGTNEGVLEVSNLPPLDLGKRLGYLLGYPYGCLEQTTSKAFPQLYMNRLVELSEEQKQDIPDNIQAALDKYARFRRSDGSFSYWPGGGHSNSWANNYAGHFMLEAEKLGYSLSSNLKESYLKSQTKTANLYDPRQQEQGFYRHGAETTQAYRLYVLALANQPALGAMNRMREAKQLAPISRWMLASAYVLAGKPEVGKGIIASLNTQVEDYRDIGGTFGSRLRDKAIILEALNLLDEEDRATEIVKEISDEMSSGRWLSTQETAFALLAVGKFIGDSEITSEFKFAYKIGSAASVNAGSNNPILNVAIPLSAGQEKSIMVDNTSGGVLYARILSKGQPATGAETKAENKLKIAVKYMDTSGNTLNPAAIPQGTDFVAQVQVTHPGGAYKNRYDELAIDQIFPSGWEILNSRMDDLNFKDKVSRYDYQDVRDDRVYTFFDLNYGKTATYSVRLNAAYQGRYYLPAQNCSAMYDEGINAREAGQWVEVTGL